VVVFEETLKMKNIQELISKVFQIFDMLYLFDLLPLKIAWADPHKAVRSRVKENTSRFLERFMSLKVNRHKIFETEFVVKVNILGDLWNDLYCKKRH
jgi:hypothetical protein